MTYIIVHLIDTIPRLRGFMATLVLIMAGLSTALLIRFFAMPWTRVDNGGSGGMIGGFLGDGNDFALAQNVVLPWAITLLANSRNRWLRLLMIYAVVVGVLAVACTFSRGGVLGLLALLAVFYVIWVARSRRYVLGAFLALIGVGLFSVGFLAFAPEDFIERMTSIKDYNQDESALGRLDAWRAGAAMFADHPFFGVGANEFSDAYGEDYKPVDAIAANWRTAHNVYIQTAGELGLTGLLALFGLMGSLIYMVRRARLTMMRDPADDRFFHGVRATVAASLVAWAVCGAFLSVAYYPHLFLLVMLTSCLERFSRFHAVELPIVDEVEES
jgi:probable O-glycosylation ligase (exosortase A-associated)